MGRGPSDIQDELRLFPFRIDPSSKNVIRVILGEKVFTPPEISAFILRELKNWAESFFGEASLARNHRPRIDARSPASPKNDSAQFFSSRSMNAEISGGVKTFSPRMRE